MDVEQHMTREELHDLLLTTQEEIANIKWQLKHSDKRSNKKWAASAEAALNAKRRQAQRFQAEMGRMRREKDKKIAENLEHVFFETAKEKLPREQFREILMVAQAEVGGIWDL